MRNSTPILLGDGEISALDESEYDTDGGAIQETVVRVGRKNEFDGVQVLSEGTIFVQSVVGEGNATTYVYPVGAGVTLQHDYINRQDRFTPAAFLIYRTDVRIDPTQILPSDIVCCPLEKISLGDGYGLTGWLNKTQILSCWMKAIQIGINSTYESRFCCTRNPSEQTILTV
jgi:hypothetical protein